MSDTRSETMKAPKIDPFHLYLTHMLFSHGQWTYDAPTGERVGPGGVALETDPRLVYQCLTHALRGSGLEQTVEVHYRGTYEFLGKSYRQEATYTGPYPEGTDAAEALARWKRTRDQHPRTDAP